MKHLFSFRQRPNETLTHSTTRGLNGSRMVVETTVKGRSNDCRMTVGRLSTLFLLLFALSFGFSSQAWANDGFYEIYGKYTTGSSSTSKAISTDMSLGQVKSFKLNDFYLKVWDDWTSGTCYTGGALNYMLDNGSPVEVIASTKTSKSDNNYEFQKAGANIEFTTNSGSHTVEMWGKVWGNHDTYLKNGNNNYKWTFTILPPDVSNFAVSVSGYISGSGTNADPYLVKNGNTLSLTASGSQAHTDANSSLQYKFGSGSYSTTTTNSITVTNTTATSFTVKAKCYNSSASLSGTESSKTIYYKAVNVYTVTYDKNGATSGSVPTDATEYVSGTSVTVKSNSGSLAKTGYTFSGWNTKTDGTGDTYAAGSGTFSITSNTTLYAKWTEKLTTVTISSNGNGTVSSTSANVGVATTESVSATPADGYHFDSWAVTGNADIKSKTTDNPVTLYGNGSGSSGTLKATFAENTHNITISNDGNGTTSPTGAQTVGEVTGISITATPAEGYGFKEWVYTNGTISSTTATTTFKPTADNATIQAMFQSTAVYYDLTVGVCSSQSATQGTVSSSPTAGTHIQAGTVFTLTATPATSYEVEGWYSDAACTGSKLKTGGNTYEFTLNATCGVYVKFIDHKYDLKVSHQYYPNNSSSRTTSLDTHDTYDDVLGKETGYNVNTASKVRTGYYHNSWVLNTNASVTVGGSTTTTTTDKTATITGATAASTTLNITSGYATYGEVVNVLDRWKEYARTVNVSATTGGSIQGGATSLSNIGSDTKQSITAVEGTGYNFNGWTKTDNPNYTINIESPSALTTNITVTSNESAAAAGSITANFVPQVYNITYMDKGGVAFTGLHEENYPTQHTYGTATTLKGATKSGYQFDGWFDNPACTGTALTQIGATAKTANFTLYAKWTEVLYNVIINSSNEEGATLYYDGAYHDWGSVVQVGLETTKSITVTPNPGYKLNAFSRSAGGQVSGGGTSFTVWADGADGTVTANPVSTPTVFFDNTNANWSNVYVYLMKGDVWEKTGSGKGAAISGEYHEYHQMTRIGTSNIYYYSYTTASPTKYIAFSSADMHTYGEFYGNNGTYRGDFNECQPMFIPDGTHSKTNNTEYYNSGNWDTYSTTSKYYIVGNDAVFGSWSRSSAPRFTKESATSNIQTVAVTLVANHTYQIKLETCADSWYSVDANTTITSANCTNIQFASDKSENCSLSTTVAGTYTFTFDNNSKKLSVEYPAMPAPEDINVTVERYYGEDKINTFIETTPAYKVYTDEQIKLTIDEVVAPTGCTTYYQFGDNAASTTRTYTFNNIPTTPSSIEAKVFFRPNSGGKDGDATTETINYQGVATPTLYLTTSWSEAQEGDEVPENVTIFYNTANYSGPATVTRSKDGAPAETFFTVPDGTKQMSQIYNLPDQNVQRQTFVATATANERTFTATKAVSIYRLVEITITDEHHRMDHYYMWENGTNPLHEETAWPGDNFFSTLGDAHIFYVKYPSYTHFVLNDGKQEGAIQTVNVAVPNQSTCYTIGEKITAEGDDKGKYAVQVAVECPNKLYVGDIDPVSAVQGEGVIVSPQVDIDPLLDANNLTISFDYGFTEGITCDQRGRSFMVTATAGTGTYEIQVTYSIPGAESVTKDVTINVTSAIMIQAKYGNLGWADHNEIYIHYWGTNINATQKMTWKDYVGEAPNKQDRVYARIPLDSNNQINFQIYAWNMDEDWHVTKDVTNVTESGCYIITPDPKCENGCKRNINREGENCWTAYYVEIDMNNGTVYRSNTVEDLTKQVSFFAPGSSESQAKAGAVRIICNGSQTVVVPAATFTKSGIYTAKITANGEGLSDVASYTGDYYIRTDAAEGGWNDYVKDSHKFTYFTPYEGALYDYYWVMNKKVNNQGDKLNIKGCVGNGINDNLANMIEASNYTDGYGDITPDVSTGVNLRFGYNPETNYFERSILRGSTAGESNFLNLIGANIYNNKNCTEELNEDNYKDNPEWSKFGDISNWVYEKNIYVEIDGSHPSAQALLKSKAFNGTTIYQLGYTLDNFGRQTGTPAQRDILGLGTTQGTYNLRIIYDFKTNRIVSAWSPVGDVTYSTPTTIEADVLFVRHEDTPVAQVKLDNDAALVSELNSAYFVMEIDGASQKSGESMYWFSVPFDCEISSIFGVEGYVTLNANGIPTAGTWGIQEYDGETRAQKGWYIEDTQTFWRWKHKSEKLLKGNGYILVFDRTEANNQNLWKEITREEPCEGTDGGCQDGKKTVTTTILRLYFPSSESGWDMTRSDKEQWVEYPDWTCTKPNRKAQDSNWRLLGTNSYSNIKIDEETQFERRDDGEMLDKAPNFVYEYHPEREKYDRYVAASSLNRDFLSFNCYMVQFSGRINWNQYTQSEKEGGTNVAARRVVAENELTNAQMTLSLKKGNTTEDNTYIYMDTRATTDFDNQMDLTKITDTRANQIYSVTNEVEYAGNTLPVEDQIVPLTVNINANGAYTFAMPEMTDGLEVYLMDNATNAHIDMAIDSYTVDLNKGKIADRFYLDVRVKERTTPTIIETIGTDGNPTGDRFIKVIQNDQLHIIRNGRIYNASGMELNR